VSDGLLIPASDLQHPSGSVYYIPPTQPPSYMEHWNLNLQRALTPDLLLDVAYAGSRGVHLLGEVNLNQAPPGAGTPSTRAPILASINSLTSLLTHESSFFHSLQVKLERRFSHGFYLLTAYTLSKSIDEGSYATNSGDASSTQPQDSLNWRAERGLSDFDVRHRFVLSYIYELPFGKGKRFLSSKTPVVNAIFGGWQINGITTLQSGSPFTPVIANSQANAGSGGSIRPNRIGSGKLPSSQQTIYNWFDKSAFVNPAPFTFGNSGRNIVPGPKLVNFDFSLFKDFRITEALKLEFRSEFFNIFNTPSFGLPNRNVDTAQAGIITYARDGRQIQFALKLLF